MRKINTEMVKKDWKRFEWLLSFLIIRYKFVHTILGMMTKSPSYSIPTMGVRVTDQGKFELSYNPEFTASLEDAELTYVFYHEVMHLALHHCTSRRLVELKNSPMLYLANIAYDLAVNELIPIENENCRPPRDEQGNLLGQFVSEYKKKKEFADIEERQTAEWYFDYLKSKMSENKSNDSNSFDDHSEWKECEIADERVRAKIKEIEQNDLWGSMSQTERELILAAQIKKINWRNKIRTFFGNLAWRYKAPTRKRPNRRFGYIFPGTRKLFVDRWLIAADTSGSVDNELLAEWLGVVNQLAEELPIDFMQFDCDKTEDPWSYDRRFLKLEFKGRGGTNFQPVIDIVNKKRYKAVMILTDGEAPAPSKPKIAKVLWVLPSGKNPPVDWGDRVHLVKNV